MADESRPSRSLRLDQPVIYQIQVQGRLDASWSAWFDEMTVSTTSGEGSSTVTTLTGLVRDQVALHSLLIRIRDLGLPLLYVQCLDGPADSEAAPNGST